MAIRISAKENDGMRGLDLMIGLEAINYIYLDIHNLSAGAGVTITPESNLGQLMEQLEKFKDRGFGGKNVSIYTPEMLKMQKDAEELARTGGDEL